MPLRAFLPVTPWPRGLCHALPRSPSQPVFPSHPLNPSTPNSFHWPAATLHVHCPPSSASSRSVGLKVWFRQTASQSRCPAGASRTTKRSLSSFSLLQCLSLSQVYLLPSFSRGSARKQAGMRGSMLTGSPPDMNPSPTAGWGQLHTRTLCRGSLDVQSWSLHVSPASRSDTSLACTSGWVPRASYHSSSFSLSSADAPPSPPAPSAPGPHSLPGCLRCLSYSQSSALQSPSSSPKCKNPAISMPFQPSPCLGVSHSLVPPSLCPDCQLFHGNTIKHETPSPKHLWKHPSPQPHLHHLM